MKKKYVISSQASMDPRQCARIITASFSLIQKKSHLKSKLLSLKAGVKSIKPDENLMIMRLFRSAILFLPPNTSSSATQTPHIMLLNMLAVIYTYQKFYNSVKQSRSTYKVKTLLLASTKLAKKKFSHLSTEELLRKMSLLLTKMELKQRLVFEYPKIHYVPFSANATDLITYLIIQNMQLIASILDTCKNGKNL